MSMTAQPIVILGGFMSFASLYGGMRDELASITGQPVAIVQTFGHDWLPSVTPPGWTRLLRKLDRAVRSAVSHSVTGKVTLVGHSMGGVLSRLYLSPQPFMGQVYHGLDAVDLLITLGSPHHNQAGLTRGGVMSRWVERHYPGAFFAPRVEYVSVAGKAIRGDLAGTGRERWVYRNHAKMCGRGDTWGDGIVPVESALLRGSRQMVLEGVGHFSGFGARWYGDRDVILLWMEKALAGHAERI
jgi:pimeloyl-ACP methyl ester carboxylesterase